MVKVVGSGRDGQDVGRIAVERDVIEVVATAGRDGDAAGVAVQRDAVGGVERVAADGDVAAAGPKVDRAVGRGDGRRAGKVRRTWSARCPRA